jgi:amidase
MANQLWRLGAREIAARVAAGRTSVSEVVRSALDRVAEVNGVVNAICTLNPMAEAHARDADRRLAEGGEPRPLEGVPFVIKDNIETRGLRTTFGSLTLENNVPELDGICVERLRAAGGILLGKGNTPEFAHDVVTTNRLFGPTRNPWQLRCTAGGSSGGSAAAVAAGMVPLAIGTDLGGSVRVPASFTGIVGLRTLPGVIPIHPTEFAWDTITSHVHGPFARSVDDICLAMSVLAGPDARDPRSLRTVRFEYEGCAATQDLAGKRLFCVRDFNGAVPMEPEVLSLAEAGFQRLEALGAELTWGEIDLAHLRQIITGTRAFGMVARYSRLVAEHRDVLTPQLVNQVESSSGVTLQQLAEAERLRTAYWHQLRPLLTDYDAIVTPATGITAFALDEPVPSEVGGRKVERFYDTLLGAYAFTVVDAAGLVVPCGRTGAGLPAGLQIVGGGLTETAALNVGIAYEKAYPELFELPDVDTASPVGGQERAATGGFEIG